MKYRLPLMTLGTLFLSVGAGIGLSSLSFLLGGISPDITVGAAHMIVLALLFLVFIVEIVSVLKIKDSTFHTVLIAGCIIALYFFSVDTRLFFSCFGVMIPAFAFDVASEIAFVLCESCCCWYIMFLYGIEIDGKMFAVISLLMMFSLLFYAVSFMYGWGFIVHFFIVAVFTAVLCVALYRAGRGGKIGLTTYLVAVVFCLSAGVQSVNSLCNNDLLPSLPGVSMGYAFLTFCMFLSVYFAFSVHADLRAVRSDEYKSEALSFKTRALAGQIKPHFIFNSLEAVRALYHKDIKSGDTAITLLSDFLRGSVNAFDSELVPFETELDNVYTYTEFENLKRQKKIDVIFDTDYTDFMVPPFSVQPLVENAMKYSGVEEKEDGRIVISSAMKDGKIVLEISDNGKGFDPSKVGRSSHGIRNVSERFRMALSTEPQIFSAAGEGTRITIEIEPARAKGETDEDRSGG